MQVRRLIQGDAPLLVSIPHMGTFVPPDIKARMTDEGRRVPDTDWALDRLYDFAAGMGASVLMSTHARYVIDLNRDKDDTDLYPGQVKTGLCPLQTFSGAPIYQAGEEPEAVEQINRIASYWLSYHDALRDELARIKSVHGYAILYDAHSIRSEVPRLFEGALPDLNLGTGKGVTCAPEMAEAALQAATGKGYSSVLNGRFVGGYITRHYGDPAAQVHAIQMELAQKNYMDEDYPFTYQAERADRLKPVLKDVLQSLLDWGAKTYC